MDAGAEQAKSINKTMGLFLESTMQGERSEGVEGSCKGVVIMINCET